MREYLVTDLTTGKQTWTPGPTQRQAVISHENARRAALSPPLPPLPMNAALSRDDNSTGIGESVIRGLSMWTVREVA